MSLQFNGLNISEMQFNGLNIVEAMYNGEIVYSAGPAANYPQSGSWGPVSTSAIAAHANHTFIEDGMYKITHTVSGTGNYRSLIADEIILKQVSSAGQSTATAEHVGGFLTGSFVGFASQVLGASGTTLNLSGTWKVEKIPADQEISGSYIYQNVPQTTDAVNDPKYLTFINYLVTEPGDYRFRVADTTPSANFLIGLQVNSVTVGDGVVPPAVLDRTLTLNAGDVVRLSALAFVPSVYTHGGTWSITPL